VTGDDKLELIELLEHKRAIQYKTDFQLFAEQCLVIRTKSAGLDKLKLNKAQIYVHDLLERQKKETGRVRAMLLKGRQQGASTYIQARFYHLLLNNSGMRAFILTHDSEATENLFAMSKRFHDNMHDSVRPEVDTSNARELIFKDNDSGYKIGTAGNKATGRSQTNQYFHGSEVDFWPNAGELAKGVMQTVPDSDGTEIIYESTANGIGNFFHQQWKAAESGRSDFITIFVPWFWQDEYRKDGSISKTELEHNISRQYGLDDSQILWMRHKIVELSTDGMDGERSFKQEYPCNAAEAFQHSGQDGLIRSNCVMAARKAVAEPSGPKVIGVDPSRGGDRFSVAIRMGRKLISVKNYQGGNLGSNVSICKTLLDAEKPGMMFIDAGGGIEIVDRLKELGYRNVKAIYFGASPFNKKKYKNKRGEMWGTMNEWLNDEHEAVDIPDSDELQADLCASPYVLDSQDRQVLASKDKIKKEYGFSPDEGDATALTFAEPISSFQHQSINFSSEF
jgi:hypothetical protein